MKRTLFHGLCDHLFFYFWAGAMSCLSSMWLGLGLISFGLVWHGLDLGYYFRASWTCLGLAIIIYGLLDNILASGYCFWASWAMFGPGLVQYGLGSA
jgi:hypothetical protein